MDMSNSTPAGAYAKQLGGQMMIQALSQPGVAGTPPHRFTKLVLDRWALEEPNRFKMLCQDETRLEWLMESAEEQGDLEMNLLTSEEAQRQREQGMMDTDILMESTINLRMPESLPFRHMDN